MNTYSKLKLDDLMHILEAFADGPEWPQWRGKPTVRAREAKFRELWLAGRSQNEIARKMGISAKSVGALRRRLGLPRRMPVYQHWKQSLAA